VRFEAIAVRSSAIVFITALFTGMVLALQTASALGRFGAKPYTGSFVGLVFVLELGPVLTAVVVAGRVGAGITAELGSMAVSEPVDAIRALDRGAFLSYLDRTGATVCGARPIALVVETLASRKPLDSELLSYYTSGDVLGDWGSSVSYVDLVLYGAGAYQAPAAAATPAPASNSVPRRKAGVPLITVPSTPSSTP